MESGKLLTLYAYGGATKRWVRPLRPQITGPADFGHRVSSRTDLTALSCRLGSENFAEV